MVFLTKKPELVDVVDSHEVCTIDVYDPSLHISLQDWTGGIVWTWGLEFSVVTQPLQLLTWRVCHLACHLSQCLCVVDTRYISVEITTECAQLTHPYPATTMIYDGKLKTVIKWHVLCSVFFRVSQIKESGNNGNPKNNRRHLLYACECSRSVSDTSDLIIIRGL